jgi:hypothetical protein
VKTWFDLVGSYCCKYSKQPLGTNQRCRRGGIHNACIGNWGINVRYYLCTYSCIPCKIDHRFEWRHEILAIAPQTIIYLDTLRNSKSLRTICGNNHMLEIRPRPRILRFNQRRLSSTRGYWNTNKSVNLL